MLQSPVQTQTEDDQVRSLGRQKEETTGKPNRTVEMGSPVDGRR
jgi:hypothetical protein